MATYRYQHGDRPLEGYTIEYGLGRGGFGEVYYAISDAGREVALKVVQNYEEIELRGIRQCMNLKSPHLVTIFDVRRNERDEPFVIMEYVDGPSLRQLLDDAPQGLGAVKTAYLVREIAKGLTYLHDCGVVHRDLKPHNVFFENGYVKIGDYSLSKLISSSHRSGHTATVGTVHYMAPEISEGRYDARIDIYALGIMLFEMLTGRPPFEGQSMGEILLKHVTAEPDLSQIAEPFRAVIARALAKNPDERFSSAAEMVRGIMDDPELLQGVTLFRPDELEHSLSRTANHSRQQAAAKDRPPPLPPRVVAHGAGRKPALVNAGGGESLGAADSSSPGWPSSDSSQPDLTLPHPSAADTSVARQEPPSTIGERINFWHRRIKERGRDYAVRAGVWESFEKLESQDVLSVERRACLAIGSATIVAIGASRLNGTGLAGAWSCSMIILTATLVLFLVRHAVLPQLRPDRWILRRLVVVAACFASLPVAFLLCTPAFLFGFGGLQHPSQLATSAGIGIVSFALVPFARITDVARPRRVMLRMVILLAVLAFLWASATDNPGLLAAGIAAGIALATQVSSPYRDPSSRSEGAVRDDSSAGAPASMPRGTSRFAEPEPLYPAVPSPQHDASAQVVPPPANHRRIQADAIVTAEVAGEPISSSRTRWAAFAMSMLFFFTGLGGLQRFYVGRWVSGLVWLCTGGLLGIGQLFDTVMILMGTFRDAEGRLVAEWEHSRAPRMHPVNHLSSIPAAASGAAGSDPWASGRSGQGRWHSVLGWCGGVCLSTALLLLAPPIALSTVLMSGTDALPITDPVVVRIIELATLTGSLTLVVLGSACLLASRIDRGPRAHLRTVIGGVGISGSIVVIHYLTGLMIIERGPDALPNVTVFALTIAALLGSLVLVLYPLGQDRRVSGKP